MKNFKKYLFIIPLFIIGLVIPNISYAASWLTTLATNIVMWIPYYLVYLFITALAYGVELVGIILNWVLSPSFISMSYTNPASNDIIRTGLAVTQGLVNMILVLILIYIAIATILRLQEYQAQKLLPIFIVIALLVNFTPVICGIIVDASNILMNFFVSGLNADSFGSTMRALTDGVNINFTDAITGGNVVQKIIESLILSVFLMWLIIVLLIFVVIFVLRYMAIWILVILSPIAFISYILPITKKYWSMWWQQFLNWCFIGVTCGFFLYLSFFFIMGISREGYIPPAPDMPGGTTQSFKNVIPLLTGIVFLFMGLIVGLKTSAMGASTVIKAVRSRAEGGYKWGGRKAAAGGAELGRRAGRKVKETTKEGISKSEKVQKLGERMAATKRIGEGWGQGDTGVKGALKRAFGSATKTVTSPLYHAVRKTGEKIGPGIVEDQKEKINKKEKEMEKKEATTLLSEFNKQATLGHRGNQIGVINAAIKDGKLKDLMDKNKFGNRAITDKQLDDLYNLAKKWGSDSTIKKARPDIAAKNETIKEMKKQGISPSNKTQYNKILNQKTKEVVVKMKPEDYKNISSEALKDQRVMNMIIKTGTGKGINNIIDSNGKEAIDEIEEFIKKRAKADSKTSGMKISPEEFLKKENPRLHKYLTQGQGSGMIDLS